MSLNPSTFAALRAANIARQAEWDTSGAIDLAYRGNELAGEVGEACNIIKKLARERLGIAGSRATVAQLADELADIIICTDLVALGEGIDLWPVVVRKFNTTSDKVGLRTRLLLNDDPDVLRCPICAEPFVDDDLCSTDIDLGTVHAACAEGSAVVDLATGEPKPDGQIATFRFGDEA